MNTTSKRLSLCAVAAVAAAMLIGPNMNIEATLARAFGPDPDAPRALQHHGGPAHNASWEAVFASTSR
jgi:hypothetical protein